MTTTPIDLPWDADQVGSGPRLHRYPYSERFMVRRGASLFTVGEERLVVSAGQVLVAPTSVPHRFEVLDRGLFESINIHANDRFVTEWLE